MVILECLLLLLYLDVNIIKGSPGPAPWDWQQKSPNPAPAWNPYGVGSKVTSSHERLPEILPDRLNITALAGDQVILPCRLRNLGKFHTVSWIRRRDVTVLTVGRHNFNSDQRFAVIANGIEPESDKNDNWNLHITNLAPSDQGYYECQVNTEPKVNRRIFLNIEETFLTESQFDPSAGSSVSKGRSISEKASGPTAVEQDRSALRSDTIGGALVPASYPGSGQTSLTVRIAGPRLVYIAKGHQLRLTCSIRSTQRKGRAHDDHQTVTQQLELTHNQRLRHSHLKQQPHPSRYRSSSAPSYTPLPVWIKDGRILEPLSRPSGGFVLERDRLSPQETRNRLYILSVQPSDTGKYYCRPGKDDHRHLVATDVTLLANMDNEEKEEEVEVQAEVEVVVNSGIFDKTSELQQSLAVDLKPSVGGIVYTVLGMTLATAAKLSVI